MSDPTIIETLRTASKAIYIAVEEDTAKQISITFRRAANHIASLEQRVAELEESKTASEYFWGAVALQQRVAELEAAASRVFKETKESRKRYGGTLSFKATCSIDSLGKVLGMKQEPET
jgi:hypothetical protein